MFIHPVEGLRSGLVCVLVLVSLIMPAVSQTMRADCGNPDPDISIAACTRKIESDSADLKAGRGMLQAVAAKLATDYDSRGVAYAAKRLYDQAVADYNQAISLSPSFPVAYFNRANAYYEQGLDDQAILDYTKAMSLEPEDANPGFKFADAYNYRGNAYEHKGRYDEAIADFTEAISRNPTDADAYDNRGLAYAHKGQYDQAVADYTQELALHAKDIARHPTFASQYARAYGHRGEAYEHKGARDSAVADYRAALKLDSNMPSAKEALVRLDAGP